MTDGPAADVAAARRLLQKMALPGVGEQPAGGAAGHCLSLGSAGGTGVLVLGSLVQD